MALSSSDRLFRERESGEYECTVKDPAGNAIPLSKVTSLTLTLVDIDSGDAINSRDNQDVLNTANVSYTEAGLLTWLIKPADNAIIGTVCEGKKQRHRATFEIFWDDGGESFEHNWSIEIEVISVGSVS